MLLSNGKNNFKDNKFSFWEWSAPILQTFEEVMGKIRELNLKGRVIKGFYAVGMAYNWREDDIGEAIFNNLENMVLEKRIRPEGPFPFLPEGVFLSRYAELDEPFLIEFEDGDILAIDYCDGSSVRMDMNTVPEDVHFGINRRTFHPNVLFASLIGHKITAVEVTASTECDEFTWSHGLDIGEQDAYITKISIVCEHKDRWEKKRLEFSSFYDFAVVSVADEIGNTLTIHAPDIKAVVEGFMEEDIFNSTDEYQIDEVTTRRC